MFQEEGFRDTSLFASKDIYEKREKIIAMVAASFGDRAVLTELN
jgi:hypothetical protein